MSKFSANRTPKTAYGLAWYKQEQWQHLLDVSADKDNLENTYAEWVKNAEKALKQFQRQGMKVVKVNVDIDDLCFWCQAQNIPVNGESRVNYVAFKLQQMSE